MLKKLFLIITIILFCICYGDIFASAEQYDYGTNELYEAVPDNARNFFEKNNITADGNGIAGLTLSNIVDAIITEISEAVHKPAAMFTAILAVIILTSVLGSLSDTGNTSTGKTFSVVSALTSTIIISSYLSSALEGINTAISTASDFSLTYIPVIAGVIAVGGHASTAAVYTSVMMIAIQILTQITVNILLPVTSCLIGISAAGGLNSDLKIDKLGEGLKKAIVWGLGLIMTVFIGFLTLQTNITSAADSVSLRAARFAVSTSVPFVGGAISDALSTVKTSVELLKSGIGSFGILTGCCILFPVLINALCYRFFLFLSGVISDILGSEDAGRMIKCGENVLSIVISMIICFFLFFTISTALMLIVCRQ